MVLVLAGCTSYGTMVGARPLPVGSRSFGMSVSLQQGATSVSTALDTPLPQVEASWRRSLAEDLDLGWRAHLFGSGVDLRYRFATLGGWDLAVAPGVGGWLVPLAGSVSGAVEVGWPFLAERDLGGRWSLGLALEPTGRETFATLDGADLGSGATGQFDLRLGAGVLLLRHGERRDWGVTADLVATPSWGLPLGGSVGVIWQRVRPSEEG